MGAELPVRIDLFDDEIDTLRTFDPGPTGRRADQRVIILPGESFPSMMPPSRGFATSGCPFNVDMRRCSIYQDVSATSRPMVSSTTVFFTVWLPS